MSTGMESVSKMAIRLASCGFTGQSETQRNTLSLRPSLRSGADLNAKDKFGNTPLHVAVENDALLDVEFLLERGVDTNILNDKGQGALHLATELNRVSVLQTFLEYKDQFNVELRCKQGRTALHYAAIDDHDICAKILITDFGAELKRACNNGYYPLHEAARNSSFKTMEVFCQLGESEDFSVDSMLSLYDSEGKVPLHSAVYGGDIKTIEVCLKFGSKISNQQNDLCTPVHLACIQGALDVVKLMFTMQPTEKLACLTSCNIIKMTPVHCAAMFDRSDLVNYLITEGSEINPLDEQRRSPLLLAATKAAWKTVHTLIRLGADIELKDIDSRNVLHLVVMNGGKVQQFAATCENHCAKSVAQLLNEKDSAGCTPLHYACRRHDRTAVGKLIWLGASTRLKNDDGESPLHIAARSDCYRIICQLLDSDKDKYIINQGDGDGRTPLHIAAREGRMKVAQILLSRGASLRRDYSGKNPLHLAAMSGCSQTIELLYSVYSHLLDEPDDDGNTPLHLATMANKPTAIALLLSMGCCLSYNGAGLSAIDCAISDKFPEAAVAMVTHAQRAEEVMALRSARHPCVSQALIAHMPEVFATLLDKRTTKANCNRDSKSFYIKYSFDILCPQPNLEDGDDGRRKSENTPLPVLNAMVAHGRVELLAHLLCLKYLQMKWDSYGKFFRLATILFYCIFLVSVTVYIYFLNSEATSLTKEAAERSVSSVSDPTSANIVLMAFESKVAMYTSAVAILVYNCVCLIREAYTIKQLKWQNMVDPSNLVSWLLYISSTVMVFPMLFQYFEEIQISTAAITLCLSWFEGILLLQHFNKVGIYVTMFLNMLGYPTRALMAYLVLIIGLWIAVYVLTPTVDLDKMGVRNVIPFPYVVIMLTLLAMLSAMLLAFGEIESVRQNAKLKKLTQQVLLQTEYERKLPAFLLKKVDKNELIEYPNYKKCKLGFLDLILRKMFYNPFTDEQN